MVVTRQTGPGLGAFLVLFLLVLYHIFTIPSSLGLLNLFSIHPHQQSGLHAQLYGAHVGFPPGDPRQPPRPPGTPGGGFPPPGHPGHPGFPPGHPGAAAAAAAENAIANSVERLSAERLQAERMALAIHGKKKRTKYFLLSTCSSSTPLFASLLVSSPSIPSSLLSILIFSFTTLHSTFSLSHFPFVPTPNFSFFFITSSSSFCFFSV